MKYQSVTSIFVAFLIALLCAAGLYMLYNKQKQTNPHQLIVGIAANYAPFVSINENGDYEGFDIDVAKALAQQMGKELIFKDLGSMAPLFMALDQGAIDIIMWGLSITEERVKKVAMIRYQGEKTTAYSLLFWQKIPAEIHTITDMNGRIVCAEPGSSQEAVLRKYPFIRILLTEKIDDGLLNIQYGKADAVLVEPAIAKKFKHIYPNIQILEVPLAPEDQALGIGIALQQNNKHLIMHIQQALEKLRASGSLKNIEVSWDIAP